jgi:hypothetical protein
MPNYSENMTDIAAPLIGLQIKKIPKDRYFGSYFLNVDYSRRIFIPELAPLFLLELPYLSLSFLL